jgi:hypothetical protein
MADRSKGRLYVGPVRMIQQRVKSHPCKRSSNIKRYKKYFNKCYINEFSHKNEDTEPISDFEWGKYWNMPKNHEFRFTESSEFQHGHFGNYFPNRGYKIDFLPYDVTLFEYATKIKEMKSNRYINLGATKMVLIDFGFMFPSSTYFVNVNMLFEFSSLG